MKAITISIKVQDLNEDKLLIYLAGGTSLQGCIRVGFNRLVKAFGEPEKRLNDGYKTDANWIMLTPDGIATIYNYKNGKNYLGEEGWAKEDIVDWNIGGHKPEVAVWVKKAIKQSAEDENNKD